MQNFLIALIVVVLLGGGYYWYSSRDATSQNAENMMQNAPGAMMDVSMQDTSAQGSMPMGDHMMGDETMMPAAKEFTVTGKNFSFAPATMTVKKGDRVRITFINSGGMHDFVIDEFNARTKVIQGDAQETIEFVADKTGSFEYYCSVGEHRQMGMKGTLVVQ